MSRRLPRLTAVAAAAVLAVAAVSGCAAGQVSQTADQVAAIDGANATVGDIGVRNARFQVLEEGKSVAAGGDLTLLLWLTNDGYQADTLTGVSTPAAASVQVTGEPTVPAQGRIDIGADSDVKIVVTGLTQEFFYGQTMPLTFSFANAGQVTTNIAIEVPVERKGDRERINIQPHHPTAIWEIGEESHG